MFEHYGPAIVNGNDWFVVKPALEVSRSLELGMLALMTVLAAITVGYAIAMARRAGQSYPIYICIGAALASFYEPVGDLFAHVTYHEVDQQLSLWQSFGFRTPLWVLPVYIIYFGWPVLLLTTYVEKHGVSMQRWMTLFAISWIGAFCFEAPMIALGYIEYYGANAPMKILGYPIWMGFANSATFFIVTTIVHFLNKTTLLQRRPFLYVFLMPMLVLGGNAGSALALGSAINSSLDPVVVNIGGLLSIAASLLYTWTCGVIMRDHGQLGHERTEGVRQPS